MFSKPQFHASVPSMERILHYYHDNSTAVSCVVFFVLFLSLVVLTESLLQRRAKTEASPTPLQALLTVLTPTCSIWPPSYRAIVDRSRSSRHKTIRLPLIKLLGDISTGQIELRDPKHNLPDLLRGQFQVYSWAIRLDVGIFYRIDVLRWLSISDLPTLNPIISISGTGLPSISIAQPTGVDLSPHYHSQENTKADHRIVGSHLQSNSIFAPPIVTRDAGSVVCFDFLRPAHLKTFIRTLQSSLQPKTSITFEFTTLGPSIAFLSDPFVLCALPYLPRKHIHPREHHLLLPRTSNPLLTSFHHIIELATSGPSPLVLESVQNVSGEYATILNSIAAELEDDRQQRNSFIDRFGKECWWEHRFLTSWESALLSAGHLTRWVVNLTSA